MTNKAGFYWHVHHDVLLEWCHDEQERVDYIKNHKLANEIETRLKWMKPVEGKLPKALVEAGEDYFKEREAYRKAGKAYAKARRIKAREAFDIAWEACNKARVAYRKALQDHKNEIEALHAKEHLLDCPWNGERLVFPKEE